MMPLKNKLLYGYCSAFLSAILFGSISTVAKPILLSEINPLTLASLTYLTAGIFIFFTLQVGKKFTKHIAISKRDYGLLLVVGLLGATLAPFLYFTGLQKTSASNASVLVGGELLFTIIIALLFFKEKLRLDI